MLLAILGSRIVDGELISVTYNQPKKNLIRILCEKLLNFGN